jgi:hypothetical protein
MRLIASYDCKGSKYIEELRYTDSNYYNIRYAVHKYTEDEIRLS